MTKRAHGRGCPLFYPVCARRGQRRAPSEGLLGHPLHEFQMITGDVAGLGAVSNHVVKLRAASVGVDQQLPGSIAQRDIATAIWPLRITKRFIVAAVFPEERSLSRI